MHLSLGNLSLLFPSLIFGAAMMVEGFLIVVLHRQITPLPTKLLAALSRGLVGAEKTRQFFAGKNTAHNARTYAFFALFFGISLIVSSFIYLNWALAA